MTRSTEPLRVLIVEHDPMDAELALNVLRRGGYAPQADVVATRSQFAELLKAREYDIVLADYRLPHWTGMDALRCLRAMDVDIPLLLVTGSIGEERAVECVKEGAADCILKERLARLPVAVRRALDERDLRNERARAVEALRASEERHRLLFESIPLPAWVFDVETHAIMAVNDAAVQHYGYTREELLTLRIDDLRQAEEVPRLHAYMRAHQPLAGVQSSGVWRHKKKDGTAIVVEIVWHSIAWGGRNAELVVANDITERHQQEMELRESEERFRQLAEHTKELFFIADAVTGYTIYLSPAYEEIWGRSRESAYAAAHGWRQGIHPDDELRLARAESETASREPVWDTYRVVRPDGSIRWVRSHAFPVRNAEGQVYRFVGIAEDFTDLHHAEEQFRQAQKMEAVGRLAGGVAHDFNNLLTVIISYCDILLEGLVRSDPRREDVGEIRKAAGSAASLTRQLLAFSRQQVIEPRLLILEEIVTNAEKMLRRLIGEDVALVTVLNQQPSAIVIDPGQLEQVIMNLAVNARDAMPTGGTLTIETAVVELSEEYVAMHWPSTPGRYALLTMSDTGIGMDGGTRARIFEPFFTTKEQGKGTGLGLATVYGIVKQSGGFIWVYSEPGHGTTFKIYLPLTLQVADTQQQPTAVEVTPKGTETILLVEDAPAVREVARQSLLRYGYTVVVAASGKEAVEMVLNHSGPIHLLVTDVVMPQMSGRQVAEQVTALRPELKVLYMSGYTDDAVLRHGVLEPRMAYLQKPFTPAALARKARQVLDAARAG